MDNVLPLWAQGFIEKTGNKETAKILRILQRASPILIAKKI
jgi:hypothetical protein